MSILYCLYGKCSTTVKEVPSLIYSVLMYNQSTAPNLLRLLLPAREQDYDTENDALNEKEICC